MANKYYLKPGTILICSSVLFSILNTYARLYNSRHAYNINPINTIQPQNAKSYKYQRLNINLNLTDAVQITEQIKKDQVPSLLTRDLVSRV